jgi:hypothetical protein
LGQDNQHSVPLLDIIDESYGTFAADSQRNYGIGKDHRIANWQNGKFVGNCLNALVELLDIVKSPFHCLS